MKAKELTLNKIAGLRGDHSTIVALPSGSIEVREVAAHTLPHGAWWARARDGLGRMIVITSDVERFKREAMAYLESVAK